jgi:glutathione S-transferase
MPLMRLYALTTIVLALKMSAISVMQGIYRTGAKAFVNPEDAAMFGGATVAQEVAGVQRAQKAWLNDLENIPIFLILALIYAIAGLSANTFVIYCAVFTIARILHTIFYLNASQPWRTITYSIGAVTTFALMIHLFVGFVLVGGD